MCSEIRFECPGFDTDLYALRLMSDVAARFRHKVTVTYKSTLYLERLSFP